MKLVKPSFYIKEQEPGIQGIYKQIEWAGRHCYKSEDKITEDSAKGFVDRMVKSGHGAMLEHGTVYLRVEDSGLLNAIENISGKYKANKYSKVNTFITKESIAMCTTESFIMTNLRVLVENGWMDDLKYICEPTEYHEKRITVHFVCDRGVSHEFVRHRTFSFAQESQRYCNYSKKKFGNEITFIIPCWMNKVKEGYYDLDWDIVDGDGNSVSYPYPEDAKTVSFWYKHDNNDKPIHLTTENLRDLCLSTLWNCEGTYLKLLDSGWTPQQARAVLPNACKTELVMTGFADDWWGEYLVIDKSTGLIDQRIHGKFYTELNSIDRDKYRIVEKGFFPLRCSQGAHPSARELAVSLREEFIKRGY